MNILITGATGFIASSFTRLLINEGNKVTCCVRDIKLSAIMFPEAKHIQCDFINDLSEHIWLKRLKGIDIVINAVGIFYHPNPKTIWKIHYESPKALFSAARDANVKKIIQISALRIETTSIPYAASKRALDEYLQHLEIPSIIIRPSLVYGHGSYGGTSLLRGLAGLPFIIPLPGKGEERLQPIYIDDLAEAIHHFVKDEKNEKSMFMAVGPQQKTIKEILIDLRRWLYFNPAKTISIPLPLIYILSLFGNLIPYSVNNTTAYYMLLQNNVASQDETNHFQDQLNFKLKNFQEGLANESSSVQDRWHARLYFLAPTLRLTLAFMWLMSAIVSTLLYPVENSYRLLSEVGVNATLEPIILYGAALINFFIGICLLLNLSIKKIGILQIVVIFVYTLIITIKLPHLWVEPFGSVVKNVPILAAVFISIALENEK